MILALGFVKPGLSKKLASKYTPLLELQHITFCYMFNSVYVTMIIYG